MFDWQKARLRGLHLCSALLLGLFLLLHLGNHLAGLAGQAAHIEVMAALRPFYRNVLVEPLLLALFLWQAGSGLAMVVRGWRTRRGVVSWLQAGSGLYLAIFLLNHVGAVLAGRHLFGLDTDFRFAAAGFFVPPWPVFFGPYYFLAVVCLFAHVGCAFYWQCAGIGRARQRLLLGAFFVTGVVLATLLVLALAGQLFPVDIPPAYRATYGA